uniref:Reelin domain-containing protein n=1 Tax=Clastoptera arizonana TaxID=38151 RepID=A0A1B6C612_9HEMI
MFVRCTLFLCLALSTVTAYNYQAVTTCPHIEGDPSFSLKPLRTVRGIVATSSKNDSVSDRCAILKAGTFYITGEDNSYTIIKFKENKDLSKGSFTQVGPDGNTYQVTVLRSYGPECGYMSLRFRCSDTVGQDGIPPHVIIHGNVFDERSDDCIQDAAAYASQVLQQDVPLYPVKNQCDNTI